MGNTARPLVVLAVSFATLHLSTTAASAQCAGSLSGAVKAKFKCSIDATQSRRRPVTAFVVSVAEVPTGVKSLAPASFDIPGKPEKKTYDLDSLGQGGTIITTSDGKSFFANKMASTKNGSVRLSITSVTEEKGSFTLHGTISATAKELGGKREIKVEVKF